MCLITVLSSVGPLARDVDSLALCMRALLNKDMFTLDPKIPALPFKQEVLHTIHLSTADVVILFVS